MLDRILGAFQAKGSGQELEDFAPLARIPEQDLACMQDPALAGRLWEPGEVVDGLYEVLERSSGRTGPVYRVRHLAYGAELRFRSPLLAYVPDARARAQLVETTGKHAEMGLHPNLVATLGIRNVEDIPRILTEAPRGDLLRDRIDPGGMEDLSRLLDLAIQVCQGLDFVHQHGLVHHDLGPGVCRVDRSGTMRLDQFFPARSWGDVRADDVDPRLRKDRAFPEEVRAALAGPIPGRPLSVAPEQWPKGAAASKASNVWALGVLLFQMATGRPPFLPYERHDRSPVASVKARVLTEEAPDPRRFRADLPDALASTIQDCLQRDPAKRPEVAAVADRLEEEFRRMSGRASPRPRFPRGAFQAENLVNRALNSLDRGREDEAALRLDEALKARPDLPEARVNRAALRWLVGEESLADTVSELEEEAEALPAARRLQAWMLVQGGEDDRAAAVLDRLGRAESSGLLHNLRGILLLQEGSPGQALTAFEKAVEAEPGRWELHHNLGICLSRTGDKEKAVPHLEKARTLAAHPAALVSLAVVLGGLGRIKESRKLLDEALDREPESAWVNYHLGVLHGSMGMRIPGFDAGATNLDLACQHLRAAVESTGGFYRARDALGEALRRHGQPVELPSLWDLPGSGRQLRDLGSLWTVKLSRVLSGHNEAVNTVTMSWDGRYIVSAGHDDSILVWDPLRGEVKSRLRGHAGAVRSVAVSADSSTLASGSDDGTARIWQLPGGPALHVLKGHAGPVAAVALSPAGSVLVTGGDDRTVRVWEARTGDERHVLEEHTSRVTAVAVSYDGALAVSASADRTVLVWELVTGGVLADLDLGEEVYSVALSSDSRYLLTGGSSRVLRLWDLETAECLRELPGHTNEIRAVSLSPDGRFALSGGWDRTVRLWNVATGECIRTLSGHEHQITTVHACADNRFGLSGSLDRTLRWWEWKEELLPLAPGRPPMVMATADRAYREAASRILAAAALEEARQALAAGRPGEALGMLRKVQGLPGRRRDPEVLDLVARCGGRRTGFREGWCKRVLEGHEGWVLRAEVAPDGLRAATGGLDGLVVLWDLEDGTPVHVLEGHGREVSGLAFSADGSLLLSSSYDRTLRVWDTDSGAEIAVLRGHKSEATGCALSATFPLALSGSLDGTVIAWNLESGEPLRELKGHESVVFGVALSPDSRRALTTGSDRKVLVWDLGSGQQEAELKGHLGPVVAARFSPDGRTALSSGEDRRALLWDLETGEEAARLEGHESAVRCADFSPDGSFAATASDDGTVRIWSVSGECLATLSGHDGPVRWVRFSPDGRRLLTAGNDRTARVWELDWEVEA